ncbi:MAG: hypothetical protein A3A24_03690 [Candidatus Buchananbacteria bacterium RIFCSPLOWO2_01_FULL_46_12]|uniref:Thioredoxin domain-containing protein n=2 Tax=Candidatus Buchananiibacteriota TaxID=1817903 RepID=A0A1G1YT59_9BACT|nr:MAG: hypothetical protein A2744_01895 [Candidatus Buchananbacteria bacterium RIFCSPHIGHO2_01_FULL_44_11]OGY55531.1 MAG: hypothetical protein A3A24_03690 [Candidatus Buchananbacteria bacterium RIFCSPLOWO2_01_FULL_46_12]
MKNQKLIFISSIALAALVIVVIVVQVMSSANAGPGQYDSFAQCLKQSGAKMYGAYWCPHCQDQKEMFGPSWQYVDYIECAIPGGQGQTAVCSQAGIDGYPTWVFGDGSRVAGAMSLSDISQKSNCPLEPIAEPIAQPPAAEAQ